MRTSGKSGVARVARLAHAGVVAFLFALAAMGAARGQAFSILHSFGDGSVANDGGEPFAGLALGPDGYLYGTTVSGGTAGYGTIYRLTASGQETTLHNFRDGSTASDGVNSLQALIVGTDGNLYGTTRNGGGPTLPNGQYGQGVAFKITPQGTYTILHHFSDGTVPYDGSQPNGQLMQASDGNFYGVTQAGGSGTIGGYSAGVVYKMTPQGVVTILHSFNDDSGATPPHGGGVPGGALVQGPDGNLYGMTWGGGGGQGAAHGVIYKLSLGGTYTVLHTFGDGTVANDGLGPLYGLTLGPDGAFYGTTSAGGTTGNGIAFKITSQGALTVLHNFLDFSTTDDGIGSAQLLLGPDGNFYGSNAGGATGFYGVVFRMTPQGAVTTLHSFSAYETTDGASESQNLVIGPDGAIYGTSFGGGTAAQVSSSGGVVFKLNIRAPGLTSNIMANGAVGVAFQYHATTSPPATSYTAMNLPDGLALDPVSGLISGTPTTVGTSTVTLTAANSFGSQLSSLTFTIAASPAPVITSFPTAFGKTGAAFTFTIKASNNPTSYGATGLPSGFTIDTSTGIISGSTTTARTTAVTISATNAAGTGSATLSIQISTTIPTAGQKYISIYQFGNAPYPQSNFIPTGLIFGFDGNLYGTTDGGGSNQKGTIYKMTDSGVFSTVYDVGYFSPNYPGGLTQTSDSSFYYLGTDHYESAGSTAIGDRMVRATLEGAASDVVSMGSYSGGDDQLPPIQGSDGNFYGVTSYGGSAEEGSIYKLTPYGVLTILHSFSDGSVANDGYGPTAQLVQGTDGNFYGTTHYGGSADYGSVFKITPQGQYTIIHHFLSYSGTIRNLSGATVYDTQFPGVLMQTSDGSLYGVGDGGTVFRMTTAGGETQVYQFGNVSNDGFGVTAMIQGYDGNLYGTTSGGGTAGYGTFFELTPLGTETNLYNFGGTGTVDDGLEPNNLIEGSDGNFYGTCQYGGTATSSSEEGTVFTFLAQQTPTHVPIFTGAAVATAVVNSPFSFTPKAKFGISGSVGDIASAVQPSGIMSMLVSLFEPATASPNWTMTGTLPSGLSFDAGSGTISGTATQVGTTTITMTPHNAVGAGTATTVTLNILGPPGITSATTAAGAVNSGFTYTIAAAGSPTSFGATFLPSWLSINASTGVISGTPTVAGVYAFDVIASNAAGQTSQTVTLTVSGGSVAAPTITSVTSANGAAGAAFTYQITATQSPTNYSAVALPPGLLFDSTAGLIFGTPTTAGTYLVPIAATNGSGTRVSAVTMTIAPLAAPRLRSPLAATGTPSTPFSFQIPATGLISVYGATGLPMGLTYDPVSGLISGTPTMSGNASVTVSAANGAGTTTATLNLEIGTPTTQLYSAWVSQHNVSSDPLATPKNDGVPDLLKYFCDVNPSTEMSATDRAALPSAGIDTTSNPGTKYLTLTYRKNAALETDVVPYLQTSTDMQNWSTVAPDINQLIDFDANGDPIMEMGIMINGTGKQFIRMIVAKP